MDDEDRTLRNDPAHRRATHERWMPQRTRKQEDANYRDEWRTQQCGRCRYWIPLAGDWGTDYGGCTNDASARDGGVTFEHDGCDSFADAGVWQSPAARMNTREALLLALVLVPEIAADVATMGLDQRWEQPDLGLFDSIDETGHVVVGIPLAKVTDAALERLAADATDETARDVVVRAAFVYEAWIIEGDDGVHNVAFNSGVESLRDYLVPRDQRIFDGWGPRTTAWLDGL
jgi:Protein of unknown function (DUF3027)